MDPLTLLTVSVAYAGSLMVHKCADKAAERLYNQALAFLKTKLGRSPGLNDNTADNYAGASATPELLALADEVYIGATAIRRARLVAQVLEGARVLWVDDNPASVEHESQALSSFGVSSEFAESTEGALAALRRSRFDVVVSDIAREGIFDEGLRLPNLMADRSDRPAIVFYVSALDRSRGIPAGAFGITKRPDELIHLILDVLERQRV